MRFKGLDLNLLVALDALLNERNITRAAEKLFLTQPAMSNALGRLRDYFNDDLLVASGRNFVLTFRAEMLIEPVREILLRIDSTIVAPPQFDAATSTRVFTLLVSDYTSAVLMPQLVTHIYRTAPQVQLILLGMDENPAALLDRGEADLLIMPRQFVSPHHPSEIIYEESYVCVTWDGNTTVREHLDFDTYLASAHVSAHFSSSQATSFDNWFFEIYGAVRRIEVRALALTSLISLVVGTDRIATVHKRLADREVHRLPIKTWAAPMEIPTMSQAMQWHQHRSKDPALNWLRHCVVEVAKKI